MVEVQLTKGFVALVSDQDAGFVERHRWCANEKKAGYVYAIRTTDGKSLHRLLMGAKSRSEVVDHINGDTLDNRRTNLRLCTTQQNRWNSRGRKRRASRHRGVTRSRGRWRADIVVNGKKYYLGSYSSQRRAAIAYRRIERRLRGDFAPLGETA